MAKIDIPTYARHCTTNLRNVMLMSALTAAVILLHHAGIQ